MLRDSKLIAVFVAILTAFGVVVFYANLSFYHFALLSVVTALVFPFVFDELPKKAVDYWYYLFGVLGLLAFYQSQAIQEDSYINRAVLAEARERMILLEELEADTGRFLQRPEIKDSIYEKLKLIFLIESNPDGVPRRDCGESQPEDPAFCAELRRIEGIAGKLADVGVQIGSMRVAIQDVETILGDKSIEIIRNDDDILLRHVHLPAFELYSYYRTPLRSNERGSFEPLQDDIELIMFVEREWLDVHESRVAELEGYGKIEWADVMFSNLWPFFLCVALCVKLARTRFTLQIEE